MVSIGKVFASRLVISVNKVKRGERYSKIQKNREIDTQRGDFVNLIHLYT